ARDQAGGAAGDRRRERRGGRACVPRAAHVLAAARGRGGDHLRRTGQGRAAHSRARAGADGVSVLVVAEHLQGRVRDVTFELVTAAQSLGGPVTVAVIGPEALDVNREGVDEIVHVAVEQAEFENDVYQRALERLIEERQPQVVLLG